MVAIVMHSQVYKLRSARNKETNQIEASCKRPRSDVLNFKQTILIVKRQGRKLVVVIIH